MFRQLVLARIIEPTSKEDSVRVLAEAGVHPASYRTIKRRLPGYAEPGRVGQQPDGDLRLEPPLLGDPPG